MTPRKKPVKKTTATRVMKKDEYEDYSPLEQYCIGLHEYYKALKKAGFTESWIMSLLGDKDTYPDWIIPDLPNKIDPIPFEDDEDDD